MHSHNEVSMYINYYSIRTHRNKSSGFAFNSTVTDTRLVCVMGTLQNASIQQPTWVELTLIDLDPLMDASTDPICSLGAPLCIL